MLSVKHWWPLVKSVNDYLETANTVLCCQDRLLIQHVKYRLQFASDDVESLQQDLVEHLFVSNSELWQQQQLCQVSYFCYTLVRFKSYSHCLSLNGE